MPLSHLPTSTTFIASATSIGPPPLPRPPCPSHPHIRRIHRVPASTTSTASRPGVRSSLPTGGDCTVSVLPSSSIFSPPRHSGAVCCAYWVSYKPTGREKIQATYPLSGLKGRRTVELRSSAYPCYPPPMSR